MKKFGCLNCVYYEIHMEQTPECKTCTNMQPKDTGGTYYVKKGERHKLCPLPKNDEECFKLYGLKTKHKIAN